MFWVYPKIIKDKTQIRIVKALYARSPLKLSEFMLSAILKARNTRIGVKCLYPGKMSPPIKTIYIIQKSTGMSKKRFVLRVTSSREVIIHKTIEGIRIGERARHPSKTYVRPSSECWKLGETFM